MKIITILLGLILPLSSALEANDFILQFIQHTWNLTSNTANFAIAPYEAHQLYTELFEPNAVESFPSRNENSITLPAVLKQQSVSERHAEQTVSLKARWTFNFQTRDTSKRHFYQLGSRDNTILVDYLRKDDVFRYAYMEQMNASVLELPLHFHEIKLRIILPEDPKGIDTLKKYLIENVGVLEDISKRSFGSKLVRVLLPRFHLDYKQNIREFYEEMGDEDLEKYEEIQQITNLKFGERGIGVFKRATVLFWNAYSYLRIAPIIVDINHPFLFIITNKDGIQFFGQVLRFDQ